MGTLYDSTSKVNILLIQLFASVLWCVLVITIHSSVSKFNWMNKALLGLTLGHKSALLQIELASFAEPRAYIPHLDCQVLPVG